MRLADARLCGRAGGAHCGGPRQEQGQAGERVHARHGGMPCRAPCLQIASVSSRAAAEQVDDREPTAADR